MSVATVSKPALYANYWEDDTTLNPTIVRLEERTGDLWDVVLPNGVQRQVNIHTLGKPHYAS